MARPKQQAASLLDQFLAVVRRYHSTLRAHSFPARAEYVANVVWIKTKSTARVTPKWMEGVELFALLAYVDWELWKHEAKQIWPSEEWASKPDHVGVDIMLSKGVQILESQLAWLAATSQMHSQSASLLEARNLALKVLVSRGKIVPHVPVRLRGFDSRPITNRIMQLVLAQRRLAGSGSGNQSSVEGGVAYSGLQVQYLHLIEDFPIDASSLQCLAVLATEGVRISNLAVLQRAIFPSFPRHSLQWVWLLLAIGDTDGDTRRRGAKHWTVSLASPSSTYPACFSAIRASGSLRGFSVDAKVYGRLHISDRHSAWSWIAYVFISSANDRSPQFAYTALDVLGLTTPLPVQLEKSPIQCENGEN